MIHAEETTAVATRLIPNGWSLVEINRPVIPTTPVTPVQRRYPEQEPKRRPTTTPPDPKESNNTGSNSDTEEKTDFEKIKDSDSAGTSHINDYA